MARLSEQERDFLAALAGGETIAGYARKQGYSVPWGYWKGREIRRKLAVSTIEEAIAMAEEETAGVSKAEFERLLGTVDALADALDDLKRAPQGSPQQETARVEYREREYDLKDHAKALGLTMGDVERLREEREYELFKKRQARYDSELAEADETENGQQPSVLDKVRDGLGGIKNVGVQK